MVKSTVTVASETLEGVFLVNNSPNIWRRARKRSAMDFKFSDQQLMLECIAMCSLVLQFCRKPFHKICEPTLQLTLTPSLSTTHNYDALHCQIWDDALTNQPYYPDYRLCI